MVLPLDRAPPRAMRGRRITRCEVCGLGDPRCLCASLPTVTARTRVVVIAHRLELFKPSNTGKLAVHVLEGASLMVRGAGRSPAPHPDDLAAQRMVLFPSPDARPLDASDRASDGRARILVVPDGSWTQARKVVRREALAAGAEAVTLPPGPPSRYGLRRAPNDRGLCTLEAIARALGVLEGAEVEAALLDVLDDFVARHRAVRNSVPLGRE